MLGWFVMEEKLESVGIAACRGREFYGRYSRLEGFGGLAVACWPLVPKFAGSNPAEAVGFLG